MNRRDRRIAAKRSREVGQEPTVKTSVQTAPVVAAPKKAGVFLRIFSRLLLSSWVINRVSHPQVLHALSEVARQSGRMDALMLLQRKAHNSSS